MGDDDFILDALIKGSAWLRRLALILAQDADDAEHEHLVQEAWIVGWKRRPDSQRTVRRRLARVLRDLAKMSRRRKRRSQAGDAVVTDDREVARPGLLLEQVRLHWLLSGLVLELDEPFRATVVARFFQDQTAAAIARSLGVRESTVLWRLREGLARLRAGLDARTGDRKAWAPAVLLLENQARDYATRSGRAALTTEADA